MRDVSPSLAKALFHTVSLAVLVVAGCGGGGGGGGGQLESEEAVEASIGVVLSTGKALPAVFLDLDLELQASAEGSAAARRRLTNGSADGSTFACEHGGAFRVHCSVDARGQTAFDIEYDQCSEGEDPARRRSGLLSLRALDPALCLTGDLRNDLPFSIELSRFSSIVSDAEGSEIARLDADLAESVNPEPGGCFTLDGTRSVSGTLHLRRASDDVDLAIEAHDLDFEVASTGAPCEQRITANGGFDVDDRGAGRRFAQTFDEAVFALSSDDTLTVVSLGGAVSNSCIGDVDLTSDEPLRVRADAACPVAGAIRLGFADGGAGIVRFTVTGGADIDFGADGTVDESVASCLDASLALCR